MRYVITDGTILGAKTKDFTQIVGEVIKDLGLPLPNYCCGTSTPAAGNVLAWDAVLKQYVPITASGVTSVTNLGYTASPTNGIITNSNGTTATLPLATAVNAGLMSPAQFSALSSIAGTANTTTIQQGDTFIQINDPATGGITFQVDGVGVGGVTLVAGTPKWTLNGVLDPVVYAGTPITTTQRNTYGNVAGYLIYNSTTGQYEYNDGTTWSALGGGGLTLSSPLTGLSLASSADITATDTIIGAFGKLQAQLDLTSTAALTDSNIFVGNASNVAVGVAMSGQAAISNTGAVTLDNAAVIGKVLTGYVSGAGTITATDSILQSIQKLDGNSKVDATETVKGIVELATQAETTTGTSTTLVPTVKTVADTYIKKQFLSNGDLLVGGLAGAETVLSKGINGQILSVDTSVAIQQLKWITPTAPKFTQSFVIADFVVGATESTLSIPFATHGKTDPIVTVRELTGVLFKDVGVVVEVHSTTNDIVIYVTNGNTFAGRIIVL